MPQKRMFSNKVIDTDEFLDMPFSAQALYFHLNLRADDDGFIDKANSIKRYVRASDDDLRILVAKRYLIVFDDGVMVVRHWRVHNTIQRDRYNPTQYQDDLTLLGVKKNNEYTLDVSKMDTVCIQNVSTDIGIDIDKDIDINILSRSDPSEPLLDDNSISTFVEIIEYLNRAAGKHYTAKAEATKKHIRARLKEGHTVDDFKRVIDNKCAKWLQDPKMSQYLRPETLFCAEHFDSYLNEIPAEESKVITNTNKPTPTGEEWQ